MQALSKMRKPERNNAKNRPPNYRAKLVVLGGFLLVATVVWKHAGRENLELLGMVGGGSPSGSSDSLRQVSSSGHIINPLGIPQGEAKPLPSLRVDTPEEEVERGIYGGQGDKKHLGGFTAYDGQGVSPAVWKHMITDFGVKSLVDVGCGKGVSTLWFHLHGVDTLCVEGSHDAVQQTLLPDPAKHVVEHDFSRGPYWPGTTYDAVWSVEFLEHVGRNFHYNYVQIFRKAALIFVSHSQWGGWHHVEVHSNEWWSTKFESYGFRYSKYLTEKVRHVAAKEKGNATNVGPDGQSYNAQHIWLTMQVYINPMVAALPEHAHLFAEHGCFQPGEPGIIRHRECGVQNGKQTEESKLPESYYPLKLTPEQDELWMQKVKASIESSNANNKQ